MFWVNGEQQQTIALGDRSFQYGDGCFTTMLVVAGQIQYWRYHQQRLENCLNALAIQHPDWVSVKQWLEIAIESVPSTVVKSGIKLHISRGVGGRGYSTGGFSTPNITISTFDFPAHYEEWQRNGIALGVCETRLGLNPLLAGHKHNNRLEQILTKSELESHGFADGVVLDLNGHITETSMANLFWLKEGTLFTPKLDLAGVAGVMRRHTIALADEAGTTVKQGYYTMPELLAADEVFITNSILGIAPVCAIGGQKFPLGIITQSLQERVLSV